MHSRAIACLLAVLLGLTACAALVRPEPPEVRLAGLAIDEIGLFEQRYRVTLRLENPNAFALDVEALRFDLALNGRAFAGGVSASGFELPANGSERAEVVVTSDLAAVLDLIGPWLRGEGGELRYTLAGEADLAGRPAPVPFQRSGRLAPP